MLYPWLVPDSRPGAVPWERRSFMSKPSFSKLTPIDDAFDSDEADTMGP